MKNIFRYLIIVAIVNLTMVSCEKKVKEDLPPEIPPYESMSIDMSKISNTQKSTTSKSSPTYINFTAAAVTVGVWNYVLTSTLGIPVAAFYNSFSVKPINIGDNKWQWTYDVEVLGGKYTARMTGQVRETDVKWEMYISKTGIFAHGEFLWFEGTSDLDENGGQWILYESYLVQEKLLQIDWKKKGEKIGDITYTYVRESSNGVPNQLVKNSYLVYGLKVGEAYNAFYNIHYANRDAIAPGFLDVMIDWNSTTYNGRIKAAHYYQDYASPQWHCWDITGMDIICEQ